MTFEYAPLIAKYGYVATFIGTLLEGETLLILSGLAAHRGYLELPLVIAVGAVGGALGDLVYFIVGRRYGDALLTRFPKFGPAATRVRAMIEHHPNFTIVAVRFMYGVRSVGPAVIGTTRISMLHFGILNVVGAIVWSACWVGAGFLLGNAAERWFGELARIERELFIAAILLAAVATVVLRRWRGRTQRSSVNVS